MTNANIHIPEPVKNALSALRKNGFEAYIIGGCVRDSLLGQTPKDYDITTSALPEETENVFKGFRVIETGMKHGTITVLIERMPIEITTYRIDSTYSDNRRPDNVTFTKSLFEDTARRDFTMNAVAIDENGDIADFHDGVKDIKAKMIRCVGDPDKRFGEDALRILRAVRFSSVLGFDIEENTKQAIFRNKELLKNISSERIASELVKLLCGQNARSIICEFIDVLGVFLPELLPMKGFDQKNPHHIYNILEHTAVAVENAPAEPILRLAALLHDAGKPQTFSEKDGIGHFYGHAQISAEITNSVLRRLKFDNNTRLTVTTLVRLHDGQIEESEKAVKRFMRKNTSEIFFLVLQLKRADNLAQAPECFIRTEHLDRLRAIGEEILNRKECFSLKSLEINGSDLIGIGFRPGKEIGNCLNEILDKVVEGTLENDKTLLLKFAEEYKKTAQSNNDRAANLSKK